MGVYTMKITEEQNETVVHFGRILTEKEMALMEICLAFFQSDANSNSFTDKETSAERSHIINSEYHQETS
jgi:hypothetical protein